MKIDIVRDPAKSDANGTYGHMLLDGQFFAFTCEQPWNGNAEGHSCIPVGDYDLKPYTSPAHGATVVFHNPALNIYGWPALIPAGTDGRSLCEIHPANWPFQLKGCVAVGDQLTVIGKNGLGVTNSVATFGTLVQKWGDRTNLTASIRNGG